MNRANLKDSAVQHNAIEALFNSINPLSLISLSAPMSKSQLSHNRTRNAV